MSIKEIPVDEIIAFQNGDKRKNEKWTDERKKRPLSYPCPSRIVMVGKPGVGKTAHILGLLLQARPPYLRIYLLHPDAEYSKDYEDVDGIIYLDEIPGPKDPIFSNDDKKILIIDDLDIKNLSKDKLSNLDRLWGYQSSHKNLSLVYSCQVGVGVPMCVKRCANVFYLWKSQDLQYNYHIAKQMGMTKKKAEALFELLEEVHDVLIFDSTNGTPYPIRIMKYDPKTNKNKMKLIEFN